MTQQQQQHQGVLCVGVSRGVLVVWLRCALDLLSALTHSDPAAVLMELSHKLAGERGGEGGWREGEGMGGGPEFALVLVWLAGLISPCPARHITQPPQTWCMA